MDSMEMWGVKGEKIRISGGAIRTGFGVIRDGEYGTSPCQVKWFSEDELARMGCGEAVYKNLKGLLEKKPPAPWFLWPVDLSTETGSFGYVLNGNVKNYQSLAELMENMKNDESWSFTVNAALNLISVFDILDNDFCQFSHMTEDDIFINPKAGQILMGNAEFMANRNEGEGEEETSSQSGAPLRRPACISRLIPPSGVMNEPASPRQWNSHMLAVVLFELLYRNHPLDGCRAAAYPVMDEKAKKTVYGMEPCFVQDPEDDSNRPVRGIHMNLLKRWNMYPDYIRDPFIGAFSKDSLKGGEPGVSAGQWRDIFMKFRCDIIACPFCGEEYVWKDGAKCRKCGRQSSPAGYYCVNENSYVVFPGGAIYLGQISGQEDHWKYRFSKTEVGKFIKNPDHPSVCQLRNMTRVKWSVLDSDGNASFLEPGGMVIPQDGMRIVIQGKTIAFHFR